MGRFFTGKYTWSGGFYALALEIGPRSDERLFRALKRLWDHPSLVGCYLERDIEPEIQERFPVTAQHVVEGMHLYGWVPLSDDRRVPCATILLREEEGSDWLDFYLPLGALAESYDDSKYPAGTDIRSLEEWYQPFDAWLTHLGMFVYEEVPFQLGLIGHEVLAEAHAEQLSSEGIPDKRYFGYLWPQQDGTLAYFPRNASWSESA